MSAVKINVPGIKAAMEDVNSLLHEASTQFVQMNDALDFVQKSHQSENAYTIQQDVYKIDQDLRASYAGMLQTHSDVYTNGNRLLAAAGEPTIPEPPVPGMWPERSVGHHGGEDVVYDAQALEHYNDAHQKVQQAGMLISEVNDLFQGKIPVAFDAQTSASIVARHHDINGHFVEGHGGLVRLLGDTAPGEVNDLFALDRQLGG